MYNKRLWYSVTAPFITYFNSNISVIYLCIQPLMHMNRHPSNLSNPVKDQTSISETDPDVNQVNLHNYEGSLAHSLVLMLINEHSKQLD